MTFRSVVLSSGGYLPNKILTNKDLSEFVDTSDEWIRERTGIHQRHIAADDEFTSDLATNAARNALEACGKSAADIDLLIVATTTPDLTFPSTAAFVQSKLEMPACTAFDVQAVCSGFVYAITTADNFLKAGQHKRALVIGAETFSRILDWEDRATCVLFGDGAGAFVLEAQEISDESGRGVIATDLNCDGNLTDLLYVDGGVSRTGSVGHVRMQGNRVFRQAVAKISGAVEKVAERAKISPAEIDWFVPHQANERIIQGVADKLGLNHDGIVSTIAKHGNTSAASIPLAYNTAREDGRIKPGDLVMLEAMGGGLTWGAALIRA